MCISTLVCLFLNKFLDFSVSYVFSSLDYILGQSHYILFVCPHIYSTMSSSVISLISTCSEHLCCLNSVGFMYMQFESGLGLSTNVKDPFLLLSPLPWFPSVFIFKSWDLWPCTTLHNACKETQIGQNDERKNPTGLTPATVSCAASASGVWCHYCSLVGQGNNLIPAHVGLNHAQGRGIWATDCWCCTAVRWAESKTFSGRTVAAVTFWYPL